jgi:hypothetical protein
MIEPMFGYPPTESTNEPLPLPPDGPHTDPDDVHLYTSPWVNGTRASNYYGPISATSQYPSQSDITFETALLHVFGKICETCSELGGNSVVGVELIIDPFSNPPYVSMTGTAARLVPLF